MQISNKGYNLVSLEKGLTFGVGLEKHMFFITAFPHQKSLLWESYHIFSFWKFASNFKIVTIILLTFFMLNNYGFPMLIKSTAFTSNLIIEQFYP